MPSSDSEMVDAVKNAKGNVSKDEGRPPLVRAFSYLEVSASDRQNLPMWLLRHGVTLTIVTIFAPVFLAAIIISLPFIAVKKIHHDLYYDKKEKDWKDGPYWRHGMNYHYFRWCPVHFEVRFHVMIILRSNTHSKRILTYHISLFFG